MAISRLSVAKAEIFLLDIDGRRPVVLRLTADDGTTGIGEAAVAYGVGATAAAAMAEELARRFVVGQDPFRIEAIWAEMYDHTFWAKGGGPIVFAGMSAVETALWDLKGRALGLPVFEMLGGRVRDDVRVYANGWSFTASAPDDVARAAEKAVADGYDALKFYPLGTADPASPHGIFRHVSRRTIDRDLERLAVARVRAVRDAVGPDVDLFLDVSGELTPDAILRLARRFEEFDIGFLEEPVDAFDEKALAFVAAGTTMPIALGERVYSRYGFRRILDHAPHVHLLQPDIGNTGGILEVKKIAAMADAFDMKIQPHICASPVSTAAALQVDACTTNVLIQELYPYRVPAHFAVADDAPELRVKNGRIAILDRPGIGLALVDSAVAPFLRAVVERD